MTNLIKKTDNTILSIGENLIKKHKLDESAKYAFFFSVFLMSRELDHGGTDRYFSFDENDLLDFNENTRLDYSLEYIVKGIDNLLSIELLEKSDSEEVFGFHFNKEYNINSISYLNFILYIFLKKPFDFYSLFKE
jgi:hypothetical protein